MNWAMNTPWFLPSKLLHFGQEIKCNKVSQTLCLMVFGSDPKKGIINGGEAIRD